MKEISATTNQHPKKWNLHSRKLMIGMAIASTLFSTACSKEKEEVQPTSKKTEQAAKDLAAIKPVTVQIPSQSSGAGGN